MNMKTSAYATWTSLQRAEHPRRSFHGFRWLGCPPYIHFIQPCRPKCQNKQTNWNVTRHSSILNMSWEKDSAGKPFDSPLAKQSLSLSYCSSISCKCLWRSPHALSSTQNDCRLWPHDSLRTGLRTGLRRVFRPVAAKIAKEGSELAGFGQHGFHKLRQSLLALRGLNYIQLVLEWP